MSAHDDAATTLEDAFARAPRMAAVPARRAGRPGPVHRSPTVDTADTVRAGGPVAARATVPRPAAPGAGADPRPRLRLVPTLPLATAPDADGLAVPPVLVAGTRRPVPVPRTWHDDEGDDRGAAPEVDARRFAHGVGLACVDVVQGRRPVAQLARWVTPGVLEALQHRAALVQRAGVRAHARPPAARRVRVCTVDAHTAEACLVVDDGVRVRAVALRLEAHRGAWRVATLEIG